MGAPASDLFFAVNLFRKQKPSENSSSRDPPIDMLIWFLNFIAKKITIDYGVEIYRIEDLNDSKPPIARTSTETSWEELSQNPESEKTVSFFKSKISEQISTEIEYPLDYAHNKDVYDVVYCMDLTVELDDFVQIDLDLSKKNGNYFEDKEYPVTLMLEDGHRTFTIVLEETDSTYLPSFLSKYIKFSGYKDMKLFCDKNQISVISTEGSNKELYAQDGYLDTLYFYELNMELLQRLESLSKELQNNSRIASILNGSKPQVVLCNHFFWC